MIKTILNNIGSWLAKINASIREIYLNPQNAGMKPHSVHTVMSILFITLFPFLTGEMSFHDIYCRVAARAYQVIYILSSFTMSVYAILCWRTYLSLKKEGLNRDENLFFSESAGFRRKLSFYLALSFWSIMELRRGIYPENEVERINRLRHQSQADFFGEAGMTVLDSVFFSILIVELSRLLFPATFHWSDKKHAFVLMVMATAISAFRVTALNLVRSHSVM